MDNEKFSFNNLNAFIEQFFIELHDFRARFQNPNLVFGRMQEISTGDKIKFNIWANRLTSLKLVQEEVDYILEYVQRCLSEWEQLVYEYDKKYKKDPKSASLALIKSDIHSMTTELMVDLSACTEALQGMEVKANIFNGYTQEEFFKALAEIMDKNMLLLEKLALYLDHLKNSLHPNAVITSELLTKYFCVYL